MATDLHERTLGVLYIEDDRSDARALRRTLDRDWDGPVVVHQRSTLEAACRDLPRLTPDVIIIDLFLPDASGPESVRAVLELGGDAPIVVLTGQASDEQARDIVLLGVDDYLTKDESLRPQLLARRLLQVFERRRRLTSLQERSEQIAAASAEMLQRSQRDVLTGLLNASGLFSGLDSGAPATLAFIFVSARARASLDDDDPADRGLLRRAALALRERCPAGAVLARCEGACFAVVLPDSDPLLVRSQLEQLLDAVRSTSHARRGELVEAEARIGFERVERLDAEKGRDAYERARGWATEGGGSSLHELDERPRLSFDEKRALIEASEVYSQSIHRLKDGVVIGEDLGLALSGELAAEPELARLIFRRLCVMAFEEGRRGSAHIAAPMALLGAEQAELWEEELEARSPEARIVYLELNARRLPPSIIGLRPALARARARGWLISLRGFAPLAPSAEALLLLRPHLIRLDWPSFAGRGESGPDRGLLEAYLSGARRLGTRVFADEVEDPAQLAPVASLGISGWQRAEAPGEGS